MAQNFATKQLRLSGKYLTTDSAAELYIDGDRLLKANESGSFYPSSNPSGFVTTGQTGHHHDSQYYPLNSNPSGYIINFPDSGFSGFFSSALPTSGTISVVKFEDDIYYLYYSNGANVYQMPFSFIKDPSGVAAGPTQTSSRIGLHKDYISDKLIANSKIGDSDVEEAGSIKFVADQLYIYSETDASFVPISMRFLSRQVDDGSYVLENLPVGYETYLDTRSFDSTSDLGLNGYPLVQEGKACVGPYPPIPRMGGRVL